MSEWGKNRTVKFACSTKTMHLLVLFSPESAQATLCMRPFQFPKRKSSYHLPSIQSGQYLFCRWLDHFPKDRDENLKKYMSCHHQSFWIHVWSIFWRKTPTANHRNKPTSWYHSSRWKGLEAAKSVASASLAVFPKSLRHIHPGSTKHNGGILGHTMRLCALLVFHQPLINKSYIKKLPTMLLYRHCLAETPQISTWAQLQFDGIETANVACQLVYSRHCTTEMCYPLVN